MDNCNFEFQTPLTHHTPAFTTLHSHDPTLALTHALTPTPSCAKEWGFDTSSSRHNFDSTLSASFNQHHQLFLHSTTFTANNNNNFASTLQPLELSSKQRKEEGMCTLLMASRNMRRASLGAFSANAPHELSLNDSDDDDAYDSLTSSVKPFTPKSNRPPLPSPFCVSLFGNNLLSNPIIDGSSSPEDSTGSLDTQMDIHTNDLTVHTPVNDACITDTLEVDAGEACSSSSLLGKVVVKRRRAGSVEKDTTRSGKTKKRKNKGSLKQHRKVHERHIPRGAPAVPANPVVDVLFPLDASKPVSPPLTVPTSPTNV
ncbi:hypothetical protein HDV05_003852 [Chytridiales sp. JEL 0842]|nr:hypothetical protein HDV05_003852 [Chytridiales sp. JEL 0842]